MCYNISISVFILFTQMKPKKGTLFSARVVIGMTTDVLQKLSQLRALLQSSRLPFWKELPEIDLYMDQVIVLSEKYLGAFFPEDTKKPLTPAIVNNYVKMGVIPSPNKKRYTREHLARLFMLCILKQVLSVSASGALLADELKRRPIDQVYDRFCETQAALAARTLDLTEQELMHWEEDGGSPEMAIALRANLEKMLAERLLPVLMPTEPEPSKKKRKETNELTAEAESQ